MSQEIFDKDGNKLDVADIIYSFIKAKADEVNKNIEDVHVGVYSFKDTWIETYEAVDNGYDAIQLNQFGKSIKVNNP